MTLKSSHICWNIVVTFVPASLKTTSDRSQFTLFQPLFHGYVWDNVRKPFLNFRPWTSTVNIVPLGDVVQHAPEIGPDQNTFRLVPGLPHDCF